MSFISKVQLKYQLQKMGITVEGNYVRKRDIHNLLIGAKEKPLILYHGLIRSNLAKVKTQGLKPSHGYGGAGTNGVYLTKYKDVAIYWAKLQYMRSLEDYTMVDETLFDKRYGKQIKKLLAIVQVTIPPTAFDNLHADMEQAEDVGFEGSESDWKGSLEKIGDVRFDSTIPTAWIKEVSIE